MTYIPKIPDFEAVEHIVQRAYRLSRGFKGQRDWLLVGLLYSTGARVSEVLQITWDDFDFRPREYAQHGTLQIHGLKGSRDGIYPIASYVYDALQPLRFLRMPLLATRRSKKPMNRSTAYRIVRNLGEDVGVSNFHPHSFRHAMAANMRRAGADPHQVQTILRHKSVRTTLDFYGHIWGPDVLKLAGDAQKLELPQPVYLRKARVA